MGLPSQPPPSIRRPIATAPRTLCETSLACFYLRLHRQCRKSMLALRPRPVLAPQTQQTPARCAPPLVLALRARLTGVLLEQALRGSWRSEAGAQSMQSPQTLQRLCSSQQQLKEERRRNISGFCIAMPPQLVRALCGRLELVPQTQQALARCTPLCCATGWN